MNYHIYLILNKINSSFYVGSTKQTLNKRFNDHKSDSKRKNSKLWNLMKEIGANQFYILEIETINNINKSEALKREQYYINKYNPDLNERRAYQSKEQRKEYDRIHKLKNYAKHREHILQYKKEYNIKNRDYRNRKFRCSICNTYINNNCFKRHIRSQHTQDPLTIDIFYIFTKYGYYD